MNKAFLALPTILCVHMSAYGGHYCESLRNDEVEVGHERQYLLRLCDATPSSHAGPIISIEGGFLPVLEQFYFRIPADNEIELFSGRSPKITSYKERVNWPYGVIWIRKYEEEERDPDAGSPVHQNQDVLSTASEACDMVFSLSEYEESAPHLDFTLIKHELRIGDSLVVLGGGSQHLAAVLAEVYVQWNCESSNQ
ncbi:MAG: hypothetical protein GVY11_01415 [Gammaproteobacteria bacterium]|nr:hypothetical protein [Gammaproteobacteria bacterium]